ncbi:MAG TPA: hypothetical protein VM802_03005 [Chitinophaga sp.]|uniref:hypothetical protein n=1 Tax=Chitinophaga sp. TaxID=1869181 RepID=UPI002C586153|nr:hypothetical protein [Chitinophaga sp.]HVI43803.1 hypothetical protein [Chitinophaga sp.]
MVTLNLKIYDVCKKVLHLTDEEVREVAIVLNETIEASQDKAFETLATKAELLSVKKELTDEIGKIKTELSKEIMAVQLLIKSEINSIKSNQNNFTLLQYIAITGSLVAIVHYFLK